MKKWLRKWRTWLLPVCYAAWLLGWLALGLWRFVGDGARPERALDARVAMPYDVAVEADGTLSTFSIDPQLVWENLNERVRTVRLDAAFALPEGEMDLFYTRKAGQGFSVAQRAIGAPQADGSYLYTLPAGTVHSLRLDMGGANQNTITLRGITLNPRLGAAHYFVPGLRRIVGFLVAPALACCVICLIIDIAASGLVRGLIILIRS